MRESSDSQLQVGASCQDIFEISSHLRVLNNKLDALDLTTGGVLGDENCFYRAVCYKLHGKDVGHAKLRRQMVDYIKQTGKLVIYLVA